MADLAERELLGYPGAKIALSVEGRSYRITITDPTGMTQWVPGTKYEAKEMYFHPFVYGYNYSNVETEDGA